MRAQQHQQPKYKETWADANQSFVKWWNRHRDSGYIEDENGHARYNIRPHEAFSVLKYQAEYHADHGLSWDIGKINGHYLPEFTFEDFENWAKAQREFEDAGRNARANQEEARKLIHEKLGAYLRQ